MGAKKKGKKKDDAVIEAPPPVYVPKREPWINIEFKLLNWKFMNFSQHFREDTRLFTIKKILQERHGKLDSLKLCFHAFTDQNELNDEMLTLKEVGIKGVPVDLNSPTEVLTIPTVILYYDFQSTNFSDPVILYYNS
jgi:hypothetical protein